jgi:hypothetical protein
VTGEIGLPDYDAMTFSEVTLAMKGYSERMLGQYRQTRLLMYMMARMWGDPKKGPKTPEELWPLPGDEVSKLTEDDIAQMFDRLKKKDG